MSSVLFPLGPGALRRPCIHLPGVAFLSIPALLRFCGQALLALKPSALGLPPPDARPPGGGTFFRAQNLRTSVIQLFSSLWLTHLDGMGFDYVTNVTLLPSCLCK